MIDSIRVTFPLALADLPLAEVGGKARSLAKLAAAGLPVPAGFLVSTAAYKDFVAANDLRGSILRLAAAGRPGQPDSLQAAEAELRSMFEAAALPSRVVEPIKEAYAALGNEVAVAVRSSATAEDLPHLSFAGQQDSFLNVRGQAAVLDAVRRVWASLWTARAIDYRAEMGIDATAVAMGVVVQAMVAADVSGILFTANPTTGDRSELVVNASFGLGEAIVSGQVTPDTFLLDRETLDIKQSGIGSKHQMIVAAGEQGTVTQTVTDEDREKPALAPQLLDQLASLSLAVESLFEGRPQDIEWAVADSKIWLLQARPITNLPPSPLDVSWDPPSEGDKFVRRQVVENMPEPLSPLFQEVYLRVGLEAAVDEFLAEFGMPAGDVEAIVARPFFLTIHGYAYCRANYRSSWRLLRMLPGILYAYSRIVPRLLREMESRWRDEALPAYLETIDTWKAIDRGDASNQQLLSGIRELAIADANYWFAVSIVVGAAKVTDGLLNSFLQSWLVPGSLTSGMFLRGFPSKTIEAQLDLESIAARIRETPPLRELVRTTPIRQLRAALRQEPLAQSVAAEIDRYFERFGQQVYNLDFAEPTLSENPTAVLLSLRALVEDRYDTPSRQAELMAARDALVEQTAASLGALRRWVFRKLLGWAQSYGPRREEALFYMGAAWTTLRPLALELGQRLAAGGTLNRRDDVFYLESAELVEACAAHSESRQRTDLGRTADQRRELREARRRLHPPGIVPPGSRWKIGPFDLSAWETQKRNAGDAETLEGFAVSPGKVTGTASVILTPADFEKMQPDTILVCPTTTPAWTPLFAQAAGLVTDIGGILAHGSIVAREYGIPAVLGTGDGTRRIAPGQRIAVDGDAGTVTLLQS